MKKIIYLLLLLLAQTAVAQNFVLRIGESGQVPKPTAGLKIRQTVYTTSDKDCISIDRNTGVFTVKKYFPGTVIVGSWSELVIDVWIENVVTHTGYYQEKGAGEHIEEYYVRCIGNDITLQTSKTRLVCGETVQLTYSFAQSISGTPNVQYKSSSSCVTVSSSGLVTAQSPGTATITATSDLGANSSSVTITVIEEEPTGVEVTPKETTIFLDETQKLSFSVAPNPGALQTVTWSVESGKEDLMSVDAKGVVTAIAEGQGKVIATTKNNLTGYCLVTLKEPQTTVAGTLPESNASDVSVFATPAITFSHPIQKGDNFEGIVLKDNAGNAVEGAAAIDGKTVAFCPSHSLNALTGYTLTVPANAIRNKWGTAYAETITLAFSTRSKEKLYLTLPSNEIFYKPGDKLELKSSNERADIYYTTDGSTPTTSSCKYVQPIDITCSFKLKAVAMMDGYENSDVMEMHYNVSNVNILSRFPDAELLSNYKIVNPHVRFSNKIKPSKEIEGITLKNSYGFETVCEIYVADSTIYLVPTQGLYVGETFTVTIPANAVVTAEGEPNEAYEWSFNTGDYATAISIGAYELGTAIKMDASLKTWGSLYSDGNAADGSVTFESKPTPETFIKGNVLKVSSGFMHHAAIKTDGTLWMWGRQYCGEFGNNSTKGSATPVKVMDNTLDVSAGGQATAILKNDHTLWMCGRNDFGQIGNGTYDVCKSPVKVMDDVAMAVAGWCSSFAIKADGTLWAWGRNDNHQLGDGTDSLRRKPVQILEDVALVEASATEGAMFAAIKTDGSLWVWGGDKTTPQSVATDVCSVAVGSGYVEYIKTDGTLWAYGGNNFGQLGTGNTTDSAEPVKIMDGVAEVAAGGQTTMALKADGSVWTWGRNYAGALGVESPKPSASAFAAKPNCVIAGLESSELQGLTCRKDIAIVEGYMSVVEMLPIPLNARYERLEWSSSNPSVATVDERGVIFAEARGKTDVTCTATDWEGKSYSAVCHVFVGTEQEVDGIEDVFAGSMSNVRVWGSSRTIFVDGLSEGQMVGIYNLSGSLLFSNRAEAAAMQIPVAKPDVYVVRINNKSYKLLLK